MGLIIHISKRKSSELRKSQSCTCHSFVAFVWSNPRNVYFWIAILIGSSLLAAFFAVTHWICILFILVELKCSAFITKIRFTCIVPNYFLYFSFTCSNDYWKHWSIEIISRIGYIHNAQRCWDTIYCSMGLNNNIVCSSCSIDIFSNSF